MTQVEDVGSKGAAANEARQHPGPGFWLKASRERRGWSQREAADMLNLSPRFVVAMEDDTFEKLPAPAFARGYLRAYAKLLGMAGDEMIKRYESVVGDDSDPYFRSLVASRRAPLSDFVRAHPVLVVGTVAALLLALLIGGGVLLWRAGGIERAAGELHLPPALNQGANQGNNGAASGSAGAAEERVSIAPNTNVTVLPGSANNVSAVGNSANSSANTSAVALPPPASADVVRVGDDESADGAAHAPAAGGVGNGALGALPVSPPTSAPATSAPATSAPAIRAPTDTASPLPAGGAQADAANKVFGSGSDRLQLGISDECWVDVRDARGTRLYSGMAHRGVSLTIAGNAPLTVVLGNAPSARVIFNGSAIDVASHTHGRLATLTLGS